MRIQQSDGSTASKGNSLVPDEELCVGAVLNDSVLVVEDHTTGRSVRLALSELRNTNKGKEDMYIIYISYICVCVYILFENENTSRRETNFYFFYFDSFSRFFISFFCIFYFFVCFFCIL